MRSKTMLSPTQLELGADESPTGRLTSVGLFSGIGGFELGLSNSNVHSSLLCEIDPIAVSVLSRQFPTSSISHDIRTLDNLPDVDIVTAGFPCQDLSQAGMTNGISGEHSSIVDQLFRLIRATSNPPKWVILENVPFTIYLDRGRALSHLVSQFRALGYGWAYRIVDAHCSGIPQRRRRLFMVASIEGDPRSVLLSDDEGKPVVGEEDTDDLFGFYWSEGNRGVGWAPEAIPPLKGSSGVSIPTPPAIWDRRRRRVFTPDVRDAERLMGFPVDWTEPAGSERHRL
ncbi:MAG: DNA (cytosine-5-)-methyltransferase, partial [Candidatus Thalassarchaeaceae archaeon]|nr:DNA (cytosine-5-)-methyltransferase [Candidatus Thalassarchaeaceae archaeon]